MYSSYSPLQRAQLSGQVYTDTQGIFLLVYAPGRRTALEATLRDQLHRKFRVVDSLADALTPSVAGVLLVREDVELMSTALNYYARALKEEGADLVLSDAVFGYGGATALYQSPAHIASPGCALVSRGLLERCLAAARHILPDDRDAEECVSDVWLRLWNAIPPERPRSLAAYITTVTRRLALDKCDYNRAAQRRSDLTVAFEELEGCLPAEDGAVRALEQQEFRRVLNGFLRKLTRQSRTYFIRRYWYGESIREIADSCGAGEEKVKSSLFRTRQRLRTVLEKEGML